MFLDIIYQFKDIFCETYLNYSSFIYQMTFGFLPRIFKQGDIIYQEGEIVEEIYLIRSGTVAASIRICNEIHPVAKFEVKSSIGEYYVIKGLKSELIYEAKSAVEAIGIPSDHFLQTLEAHPKKASVVVDKAIGRYNELKNKIVF